MSSTIRIIPRLDIKGPNLVKGIHLEGLRVLGKPEQFARAYYEGGADELIYIDVVASLYNRNSLQDIISKTAKEIFIPLTVGGGLRTLDDIRKVLRAGADKVSMNTGAIRNPTIIQQAANLFGSSTITVAIEAIREPNGQYLAYTDNGREHTGIEVVAWAKQAEALGAGEILLTSIDREGTGMGFDLELTKKISQAVGIPVIASGGAGTLEHVREAIQSGDASAVAIASLFHYDYITKHATLQDFSAEGNTEFLRSTRANLPVAGGEIQQVKHYLTESGIPCRYPFSTNPQPLV